MEVYRFVSAWHLPGTVDQAWKAVSRIEDWPRWWPAVSATRTILPGRPDGVGRVNGYLLRAPLGYRLGVVTRTIEVSAPRRVVVAVSGHLAGTGTWTLEREDDGVRVDQVWEVAATRPWMRLLAPVARPAFRWSHDRAARRGGEGLARWLARGR
ncbi:MAG: polyketide cyclase [Actinotalea sp.]|nr:polyketide cyclase [Actinotalea sp.]